MRLKQISLFLLLSMLINSAVAQFEETESTDSTELELYVPDETVSYKPMRLKPRLGLGMGTFFYLGEVGRTNSGYNAGTANLAYKLSMGSDITSYLEAELYSIFGTFTVLEYGLDRSRNFQSEIRTGGLMLHYNFDNLLGPESKIRPVISTGFESIEFLSKADLYAANGMEYHYWTDGTIRNLPEMPGNAEEAILLTQDYVYETDLRDMDLDGLGKYQDRTWSVPVGVSAQWYLTDRFRVRLGSQMHFTFSDLIDNVSSAGAGVRKGDSKNDRILYSSLTVNYDLNIGRKNERIPQPIQIMDENGETMMVMIDEDGDNDGVNDFIDKCTNTPDGVEVDEFGCALDGDKDGVPDYMDEETWTAMGAPVNAEGVSITDEEFLEQYLMWIDSIPWQTTRWAEDYAKLESDPRHWSNTYSVSVATNEGDLTQSEINLLLSYKDVKSWEQDGEKMYLVGEYQKLPDAVARQMELESQGIQGDVMQEEEGAMVDRTAEAMEVRSSVTPSQTEMDDVIYRVQIGAFQYDLSQNIFAGVDDVVSLRGDDGLTRYMTQSYDDPQQAAARKTELLMSGFDGAFIAAYRSGSRITLADAGMGVTENANDVTYDVENNSINPEDVCFRIHLGAYENEIPTEVLDQYLEIGNVKPMRETDSKTHYLSGKMDNFLDAEQYLMIAFERGVGDAYIVGDFKGKIISAEEARMIKSDEEIQAISGDGDE